jgi:hypothetical protein
MLEVHPAGAAIRREQHPGRAGRGQPEVAIVLGV